MFRDKINGDYNLKIHVADNRATNTVTKDLGTLQINFNEGSNEINNSGSRDDYTLYPKILNYFPPEEEAKGSIIPLVFCGIIGFCFMVYFTSVFSNNANLKNLGFMGLLFVLNYFAIYAIILAFWIEVNLVNTLWILLAATPVTLFLMNAGIAPEDCAISGFSKQGAQKKSQ